MPRADAEMVVWMRRFVGAVEASPARLGLPAELAGAVGLAAGRFAAAHDALVLSGARAGPLVAAKNEARAAAEPLCRRAAMRVKGVPVATAAERMAAGVALENLKKSRVPAPSSSPILMVLTAGPGRHVLAFRDAGEGGATRRAKPLGATALLLRVAVSNPRRAGPIPKVSPDDGGRVEVISRTPFTVRFAPEQAGRTATYWGRWTGRRGAGPWSMPATMTVV